MEAYTRKVCTFRLGPHLFGIDVGAMREVLEHWVITPVPLTPPCVLGVINLRGQIMMAIDLRRRLGIVGREAGLGQVSLVARPTDEHVAFVVDGVGDVLEVSEDQLEPPPETLAGESRGLILAVCKLPTQLILVLDAVRAADPGEPPGHRSAP
ncbi:MAG: chemotaxis protein CheW [Polyangia bacterium]